MTQQLISNTPGAGTPAPAAATVINNNFAELYARGPTVTSPDGSVVVTGSPGNTLAVAVSAALQNSADNILPGSFLFANLPAASLYTGLIARTLDTNPVIGPVFSNGVQWLPLYNQTSGVLQISSGSPQPTGTNGSAYSSQLTVTGAIGTPVWSLVSQYAVTGTANTFAVSSTGVLACASPTNNSVTAIVVQVGTATQSPVQITLTVQIQASVTPAATPTFSPVAGTYTGVQTVTISCSTGSSTIYYTTNGATPTTSSAVYTTPVTVAASGTLKAIATAAGFTQSAVGSAAYTINFNPIGINFAAGGASALSYEGFPVFQDHTRSSRWNSGSQAVDANGWPTADYGVTLWEGNQSFSWATAGSPSVASASQTVATPGVFTTASQAYTAGLPVTITGTPPGGFSNGTTYYVIAAGLTATTCQLSATSTGSGIQVTSSSACTIVPTAAFSCGFTSKGTGTETITPNNGTITNKQYNGGTKVVTFDFVATNAASAFSYAVTGTTGGVTNVFNWLPAYRSINTSGYNATTLITAEAIAHYSTYPFIRNMWLANAWYNMGYAQSFTATANIGATSATLNTAITNGTYLAIFQQTSSTCDVRSVTVTGGTACAWTGGLTVAVTKMFLPNSSATRHTPTNTKTRGTWQGSGSSFEGYPAEWFVDLCVACNTSPWICMPVFDDGTYQSDVGSMVVSKLASSPFLNAYFEVGNENWNGGLFSGSDSSVTALAAFNGLTIANQMATLIHTLANSMRTAFGGNYSTQVQIVNAWQAANTSYFQQVMAYYGTQGWTPSADMKYLSVAPYINTTNATPTASLASSGVLTVTSSPFDNPLGIGSTVTGSSVPANSIVTSQLSGPPLGGSSTTAATYQLSTSGATVASEAMAASLALSSSTAQIQANLNSIATQNAFKSRLDNLAIMALHYGLKVATYEGGWQVNTESASLTNAGAATMDTGMTAVMETFYNTIFNHGVSLFAQFEGGVAGNSSSRSPNDELSTVFPITTGTSPRFAAIQNYATGLPVPTFNVVSGTGSIIQGYNWADNIDVTQLGSFNLGAFKLAPFYNSNGYCPYLVNCTNAKNYNLDVTFSGVSGSPTTDVWVNGVKVASAVAVSNGVVRVVSATALNLGPNEILLGTAAGQTAFISQIQTN